MEILFYELVFSKQLNMYKKTMVFHRFFQDLHGVQEKNLEKLRYSDGKNVSVEN